MQDWYVIQNIEEIDSPALIIYPERAQQNIALAVQMAGNAEKLRPHVKTNKMAEVCRLMMDAGITKYKCATIAEAEMLASISAPDVLLAYQPVGPKIMRLINLIKTYPGTTFSCLIDNAEVAAQLLRVCEANSIVLNVFIDVNTGMNRTGILPDKALPLISEIKDYRGIKIAGLHGYDGHIRDSDIAVRQANADKAFEIIEALYQQASALLHSPVKIVLGGTPTFPTHVHRSGVECSPGTFVFWDWGYKHLLPDEPFEYAALVMTRIISLIDEQTVCADLGHKAVAAENPLPRVHFLNAPDAVPVAQSEEHLLLKVQSGNTYKAGDVLYGVPVHICPTVALYNKAYTASGGNITGSWKVVARDRFIHI